MRNIVDIARNNKNLEMSDVIEIAKFNSNCEVDELRLTKAASTTR